LLALFTAAAIGVERGANIKKNGTRKNCLIKINVTYTKAGDSFILSKQNQCSAMKTSTNNHRARPEVNASSMADIAFLLLVFFLVTTVIETEKGISVLLPPFDFSEPPPVNNRNILSVKINYANQLLIEGEAFPLEKLREQTKEFIMNPNGRNDFAVSPKMAVISLQNDRSTNYATYLSVYNELKGAYKELWEEAAQGQFGQPFAQLGLKGQRVIRNRIPLVISENESVDFK
jgi:biopolymer transport protein ExbD